jgi:hypothetical protein
MRFQSLLPLLAVVAAACSTDPTGTDGTPTTQLLLSADVADIAADGTAQDVDMMAGMSGLLGTVSFSGALAANMGDPGGPGNVAGCGFGGGRFNCPPNRANGLTITREVTFFDEFGETQDGYDAATTAEMRIDATLEGDVSRGPWSASTFRHRLFEITGLLGTETARTVNGTGEVELSRSRHSNSNGNGTAGPTRQYDVEGTVVWADVVIPVRAPGVAPWPLSGTTTRNYTITRSTADGPVTTTRIVIINFDGTDSPDGTVNGEPFEFDLAQRRAERR